MLWRVFFVATLVGFYGLYSGHLSEDISSVAIICGSAVGLYLLIIRPLGRLFFGGKKVEKDKPDFNSFKPAKNSENQALDKEETKVVKNKYTEEFKKTVAKAAQEGEGTLKEIGERYGVNPTLVRNWKLKYQDEASEVVTTHEDIHVAATEESLTSQSLFELQSNLNHSSTDTELYEALNKASTAIKTVEEQADMEGFDGFNIESAGKYIVDARSFLAAQTWDEIDNVVRNSETDVIEMVSGDADEEGYDTYMEFLQETHGSVEVCKYNFIVDYCIYNAAEEFSNLSIWED